MQNNKTGQYGLSVEERKRLHNLWYKFVGTDTETAFGDFECFAHWAAENGFAMDKQLMPVDFRKPVTPENGYWKIIGEPETDARRAARVVLTEHPCADCPRSHYCDTVCYLRKKWWDIGMEKLRERFGV